MLDLTQVIADIDRMSVTSRERAQKIAGQLEIALGTAAVDLDRWPDLQARLLAAPAPPWPYATAVQPPASVTSLPEDTVLPGYTALAADGSQIPLDRHAAAPCYVLNIGKIALHYGSSERAKLTSDATLQYLDEDIYVSENGESIPISEKTIANRRLSAETSGLAGLIGENADRTAVALLDGPLIVWARQDESERDRRAMVDHFVALLNAGQEAAIPVAGYISRPGHREVIGLLRQILCPEKCRHDPAGPCTAFFRLTDAHLYAELLKRPGDRSPLFASHARSLDYYPEAHRIVFFYMNAGAEIARVEIPRWVAAEPDLLGRVHSLVYDQVKKGMGYPIALSEAHERAVVRAADRSAFLQLVENSLARHNIPALQTRKALAKRVRIV
jgi:hypothetical protein